MSNVLTVRREKNVSPDTCAAGVASPSADVPALVMRFFDAASISWGQGALGTMKCRSDVDIGVERYEHNMLRPSAPGQGRRPVSSGGCRHSSNSRNRAALHS